MNSAQLSSKNRIFYITKNIAYSVVLLVALVLISEGLFVLGEWKIALGETSTYFVRTVSIVFAVVVFAIGFLVKRRVYKTERLKSDFVAVAAHRLRTPLSRIHWGLDDLHENEPSEGVREKINSIKDTTEDTIGLVNYLLDATEAESTSVYYDYIFEKGHIEYIVRQVIADYSVAIRKKDIQLNVSISTDLPQIRMDKDRIRIVVGALVENSIMYTDNGGIVDIEVYKNGNTIIFSITDTGIGIPKESLPNIFSKFFRTKGAVSASTDRVGLALFIAKEIIKKHKGNIHVESEGKTKGSRFWFSLPIN